MPSCIPAHKDPIVIVGNGPAGMKAVKELIRLSPEQRIIVYGDEASRPYQRIRLSSLLAGQARLDDLYTGITEENHPNIEMRFGVMVEQVLHATHQIFDSLGQLTTYSKLILATGSNPVIPEIKGLHLNNIFTFRSLSDAESLMARSTASRHTVVLGAGLLGLEAANAMTRFNTKVTIVEGSNRLLARQLNEEAGNLLCNELNQLGISILLNESVKEVVGTDRVEKVILKSGQEVVCDTLILAVGIRPRIDMAIMSGIRVGRGILVNDQLETHTPDVYAVGECVEHRGQIYGLITPGLEQASVAARTCLNQHAQYLGSQVATKLKVMQTPVFSTGLFGDYAPPEAKAISYSSKDGLQYVCLTILKNRIIGAMAVGECDEISRLQEAVTQNRRLLPWQEFRFKLTGSPWSKQENLSVQNWPDAAVVCSCTGVTCGTLRQEIENGNRTVIALRNVTSASSVCGSCQPKLAELCGSNASPEPVKGSQLLTLGGLSLGLIALLLWLLPGVPFNSSRELNIDWDWIWRDSFAKHITGYAVLALMAALALLGLPKRIKSFKLGSYGVWRMVHIVLGSLAVLALVVHSGGRLGYNLNFVLSLSVFSAIVAGGLLSVSLGKQHEDMLKWTKVRKTSHWVHVLALWSMPTLLVFHVLKFYYFGGYA